MGKRKKLGKERRDKFYRLAKETGFRSRAAFKLLQLNRKFGFLERSKVLIDLCAAPGGWMQVAQQNMPVASLIVGVDLFKIKPIPGCISLEQDITTQECLVEIGKYLQTWKADIVLHDGSPNVGTNWNLDAYQQNCLTLSALKVATKFLREGGWFISKVFRSKDYNSLVWVFKQLFKKVHATKPKASRTDSAEIFVICQSYKAPDKLDPKFLNPKYVFEELELDPKNRINILHPEKQKKIKALGYQEGDYTLFHSVPVLKFVNSDSAVERLKEASEIVLDDEGILNHEKTTKEIKECCRDIKVLGRKEVRLLISWWKVMKEYVKNRGKEEAGKGDAVKDEKEEDDEDVDLTDEDDLELKDVEKQIEELADEERRELKRKKKKAEKERYKLQEKLDLKMILKGDIGPVDEGERDAIFKLNDITSGKQLKEITDQDPNILADSDNENEYKPRPKKVRYNPEVSYLDDSGRFYRNAESESSDSDSDDSIGSKEGLGFKKTKNSLLKLEKGNEVENENPLITDLDSSSKKEKRASKAALWFEKDVFKDLETEADEDYDLDALSEALEKKGGKIIEKEKKKVTFNTELEDEDDKDEGIEGDADDDSDSDSDSDSGSDYDVEKEANDKRNKKETAVKDFEVVPQKKSKAAVKKLDEEGLAVGTLMATSKKKKRDIIDSAWNRYAYNDEDLPDWFAEQERVHNTLKLPVPPEMIREYKNKLKEINSRPIKKVIEAKARKKRRLLKKLAKSKKEIENIMDNVDVSEREKARQVNKLYKKVRTKRKEVKYIVSKRHQATKRMRRPPGIKGPYKMVDPRMKKDNRKGKEAARLKAKQEQRRNRKRLL